MCKAEKSGDFFLVTNFFIYIRLKDKFLFFESTVKQLNLKFTKTH